MERFTALPDREKRSVNRLLEARGYKPAEYQNDGVVIGTVILESASLLGREAAGKSGMTYEVIKEFTNGSDCLPRWVTVDQYSEYETGKWLWTFSAPKFLKDPVPAVGRRGLWYITTESLLLNPRTLASY